MIDLATARETFEGSADFTVGIEEEFALVDPDTLELIPRFELLRDAAATDAVLSTSIAGELISSEIEIRSGPGSDADDARARQAEARRRLFTLARDHGVGLGATGTHPLSDYREQHIIDTEHYHRVEDEDIVVGVLAVPTAAAQELADQLVDAGVKIIFNYTDALLQVPPEVTVHTSSPAVDLLYALYFYLT